MYELNSKFEILKYKKKKKNVIEGWILIPQKSNEPFPRFLICWKF